MVVLIGLDCVVDYSQVPGAGFPFLGRQAGLCPVSSLLSEGRTGQSARCQQTERQQSPEWQIPDSHSDHGSSVSTNNSLPVIPPGVTRKYLTRCVRCCQGECLVNVFGTAISMERMDSTDHRGTAVKSSNPNDAIP